jgi:hypothetical protein
MTTKQFAELVAASSPLTIQIAIGIAVLLLVFAVVALVSALTPRK